MSSPDEIFEFKDKHGLQGISVFASAKLLVEAASTICVADHSPNMLNERAPMMTSESTELKDTLLATE
jgi:predicted dinucleotide-utilizing enzyme